MSTTESRPYVPPETFAKEISWRQQPSEALTILHQLTDIIPKEIDTLEQEFPNLATQPCRNKLKTLSDLITDIRWNDQSNDEDLRNRIPRVVHEFRIIANDLDEVTRQFQGKDVIRDELRARIQDIKKIIAQTITGSTAKSGDPSTAGEAKYLYTGIGFSPAEYDRGSS
jgi:archaellum component FlaC